MSDYSSAAVKGFRVSRGALLASTILAAGFPAFAQDVEVTEDRETPIETLTLLGADAATLTVAEGVTVSAPTGPVVTVNGPHSLSILGTLQGFDTTGGIGIFADTSAAGLSSNISLTGDILLTGPDGFELDMDLATSNAGILIDGANAFTGDLTLSDTSSITVWGADAHGVLINSPFVGDIVLDGTIGVLGNRAIGVAINSSVTGDVVIDGSVVSTNPDGAGISITGAIDGSFVFEGLLQAGETTSLDADGNTVDAIPGTAALYVGNSVSGGLLMQGVGVEFTDDGDDDDSTTLSDSIISTNGGTPALLIENTGGAGDLSIGLVDGLDYGLVMRGRMSVEGTSRGLPASGVVIEGFSATERTSIAGGLHFDTGVLEVESIDADAVGVRIGDFADVPTIWNRGSLVIESRLSSETDSDGNVTYGTGGNAYGILIEEDATVTSFLNEGNLIVGATGPNSSATALIDLSGTLTDIRNEDDWQARTTNPTDEDFTGETIAVDLRANTSGINFYNSGAIVGDIVLGSGDDVIEFVDGTLEGDIEFGAGANSFTLSGASEYTGSLSHSGSLDLFVAGADLELGLDEDISVTNAAFSDAATISFLVNPDSGEQGRLVATSTVTLGADTLIDPDVGSFVFSETSYRFLTAADLTIQTDDLSGMLTQTPFIYNTSIVRAADDANSLELVISPKSASEIGLDANPSLLYEHFLDTALNPNDQIENALTSLTTREETNDAFTSMLGDSSSASIDLALTFNDGQQTQLRENLADFADGENAEDRFWARQIATYATGTSSSTDSWAADLLSVGVTVGAEFAQSDNFAWGMSGGFLLSGISRDENIGDELSVFTPHVNLYGLAKAGGFFAGLSGSAAYHNIDRERRIAIANSTQTAESSTSAFQFQGALQAGYNLKASKLTLRPTVGIKGTYYNESGYTEENAASASLRVGSRSLSRLEATAGLAAGFDITWREGANPVIIRPELFAEYAKAVTGKDAGTVNIGFAATGEVVPFQIDEIGDDVKAAGAVLRIMGPGTDAAVRYTYRERDFIKSHEASLNFRLTF